MVRGDRVTLRPWRMDEFDLWYGARLASAGDATVNPSGGPDPDRLRERMERSGVRHGPAMDLVIEVDGRAAGEIGVYDVPEEDLGPGEFFFGIGLFDAADRGRGIGSEATRLLTDWLFEHADAIRIRSSTAVTNTPMRRVFERLGWQPVGTENRWGIEWARYVLDRPTWEGRASAD
ncbi:MAG TPA: GNAT family N-acetyltransferase [Actinomycetota bacterium]